MPPLRGMSMLRPPPGVEHLAAQAMSSQQPLAGSCPDGLWQSISPCGVADAAGRARSTLDMGQAAFACAGNPATATLRHSTKAAIHFTIGMLCECSTESPFDQQLCNLIEIVALIGPLASR
jgi:hypothetical protein